MYLKLHKLANTFYKLAMQNHSAWVAGFEHGEYDCKSNQWGDPAASFYAWKRFLKKRDEWHEKLNNYEAYKAGYQKALILNNGQGLTSDPDDHEIWEEPHHPWGNNTSRIKDISTRKEQDTLNRR